MRHHNTLLHDLMKPMPWGRFDRLVEKYEADKGVRRLSTKSQLVTLLHAQLWGATSLREVVGTFTSHQARLYHLGVEAPRRSTLADANRDRPAALFAELFELLLKQAHAGLRRHAREAVRLIDATILPLNSLSREWASYEAGGAGAKLHVVFDPDAATPVHFAVTARRINDITAAKAMPIEAGATYVYDLGYYDFAWWARLCVQGCRFVTRLKKNTPTRLLAQREVTPSAAARGVTADRVVLLPQRLKGTRTHPLSRELREVHVVIETGKTLRILSNDLDSPAETLADLYKTRWQIELFFRWGKQTLKIRKFIGTSENAVRIQLAVALIAYLLLRIAHAGQRCVPSPLAFARLVRANLMHRKSIADLGRPEPPPEPDRCRQLKLALT
jgi:transposase